MTKHRLIVYSPGSFCAEQDFFELEDGTRNVARAIALARTVKQRHGARPYGFRFQTEQGDKVTSSSMFYLGGKVRTYDEVVADNLPDEEILRWNMRVNEYKRVLENTNSYKITLPLNDGDVVLDVAL